MESPLEFKELIEFFSNNTIQGATKFYDKFNESEKKCYENAGNDVDSYVKCMKKLTKISQHQESLFRYKTEHLKTKSYNCLLDTEGGRSARLEKCKIDAKAEFMKYLNEFNDSIL